MDKTFLDKIKTMALLSSIIIVALNACQGIEPINKLDENLSNFLWDFVDNFAFIAYAFLYTMTGALLFNINNISIKTKLLNIIKYLLVPYLAWQIIISAAKVIVLRQSFESLNFFKTVFLLVPFAPDGPLYHIYLAAIISLICLIIYPILTDKKYNKTIVILLSLIGLISLSTIEPLKELAKTNLLPAIFTYLPAYLLGCLYGQNTNKKDISIIAILLLSSLALEGFTKGIFKTVTFMSIPYLLLISIDNINKTKKVTRFAFLIYAIHPVFIAIVCPIIQSLIASAFLANIVSIIIVTLLSLISSWIVYQLIKRTLPFLLPYITCIKD